MVQNKRKRTVITAVAILAVLLVAIGTVALIKGLSQDDKVDPYVTQQTSSDSADTSNDEPSKDATNESPTQPSTNAPATDSPSLDPATVATVDIVPMTLTVSYVKGIGGFEYEVLRTANGTRYVAFSSPELVGTKCTNDKGVFASILTAPTNDESSTLAKTTTVDGTKYGLSLEPETCTTNTEKLKSYQQSFSDAFSLLKKMN